jgi:Uncharacterized protein family UPF0029
MERATLAIKTASEECLKDGIEGGLFCCAAAYDAWQEDTEESNCDSDALGLIVSDPNEVCQNNRYFDWFSDEPVTEKKSVFQAHVCRVASEGDVHAALKQLIHGNTKLQKATHNMVGYGRSTKKESWHALIPYEILGCCFLLCYSGHIGLRKRL